MELLIATNEFPPFRGGVATYVHEMAVAARGIGLSPVVLAPSYGGKDDSNLPYEVVRYPGGVPNRLSIPRLTAILYKELKKRPNSAIHIADWPFTVAMGLLSPFVRRPYILTCYGTDVLNIPHSVFGKMLQYKKTLSRSLKICAISEYTAGLVKLAVPDSNVQTTLLGVSPFWRKDCQGSEWRQQQGIPGDKFLVLTVARLDRRKGHDTVLKAIGSLPEMNRKEIVYVIIGSPVDATYVEELKSLAATNGVNVRWIQGISNDELLSAYSSADLFILTGIAQNKKVEGFGLVYLEAASRKLTSIASAVGAVPEVVKHNETGLVVAPGNIDHIAESIKVLMENVELRMGLGHNAWELSCDFTWERTAKTTYDYLIQPQHK